MFSDVKEIEEIAVSIQQIMMDQGVYSPLYNLAIRTLAETVFLKNSILNDAISYKFPDIDEANSNSAGSSIVVEQSREGFLRYKANPAYPLFLNYAEKEFKFFDSMGMTAKSSATVQDDEFEELKNKMEKAANGK
jgi:hypothetical protein